jgi:hypothetical protein
MTAVEIVISIKNLFSTLQDIIDEYGAGEDKRTTTAFFQKMANGCFANHQFIQQF